MGIDTIVVLLFGVLLGFVMSVGVKLTNEDEINEIITILLKQIERRDLIIIKACYKLSSLGGKNAEDYFQELQEETKNA